MKEKRVLAFERPDLIEEWDFDKNESICAPDEITVGSNVKVWWKCKKCHRESFESVKIHAQRKNGCMYCRTQRFAEAYPDLLKEWDFEKNVDIDPYTVAAHTSLKAFWICPKCHGSYYMQISWRTDEKKAVGCPYCKGKRVLQGYNDLQTIAPETAAYWDYAKNGDIKPSDITSNSHKEYYWKCSKCGGEWKTSANRMMNQKGCPYCANQRVLDGYNDLLHCNPSLAAEWDYEKNGSLEPNMITAHTAKKVWWKCPKCGRSYKTDVNTRNDGRGSGCPYCAGNSAIPGVNDLKTLYPDIAAEWMDKNTKKSDEVGAKSTYKAWWKCSVCGWEWQTYVTNRTRLRNGCPRCNARRHTSFPEQAVYYYVKQCYPDTLNAYRGIFDTTMELDIYIPSEKIAIEYDGKQWHGRARTKKMEITKYETCKRNEIKLIRIKEDKESGLENCDAVIYSEYIPQNYKTINPAIKELIELLCPDIKLSIDAERDSAAISENYLSKVHENSLESLYPEVAELWDYELNGTLTPNRFTPFSAQKVYWICPEGHPSYKRAIKSVVVSYKKGIKGCPICSERDAREKQKKKVLCIETGEIFNGLKEAAQKCGLATNSGISSCCKGRQKSAGGYHWKFIE